MTTAEWLAFGATILTVFGSTVLWIISRLEAVEVRILAHVEDSYAKQKDLIRLETRFDSLEGLTREIRDDVRQLVTESHYP